MEQPENIEDSISDSDSGAVYKNSFDQGKKIASLVQKVVRTVRDDYKRRGESLEASGLQGGISQVRAVGLVFGAGYVSEGKVDYRKLSSKIGGDIARIPEIKIFIERHGGIDPTHGPSGKQHTAGKNRRTPSLRYESPIPTMPYNITFHTVSDLEKLVKDTRIQIRGGTVIAEISGPGASDYIGTLKEKGYSVSK
jgi:hypothetical protein